MLWKKPVCGSSYTAAHDVLFLFCVKISKEARPYMIIHQYATVYVAVESDSSCLFGVIKIALAWAHLYGLTYYAVSLGIHKWSEPCQEQYRKHIHCHDFGHLAGHLFCIKHQVKMSCSHKHYHDVAVSLSLCVCAVWAQECPSIKIIFLLESILSSSSFWLVWPSENKQKLWSCRTCFSVWTFQIWELFLCK